MNNPQLKAFLTNHAKHGDTYKTLTAINNNIDYNQVTTTQRDQVKSEWFHILYSSVCQTNPMPLCFLVAQVPYLIHPNYLVIDKRKVEYLTTRQQQQLYLNCLLSFI